MRKIMRAGAIKWIFPVWAVMVLCLLSVGRVADTPFAGLCTQTTVDETAAACDASIYRLRSPYHDDLQAKRDANRWAMPSTALSLQGIVWRTSVTDVVQRLMRMCGLLPYAPCGASYCSYDGVEQTVFSKRFHTGYYIYHRCQLRC